MEDLRKDFNTKANIIKQIKDVYPLQKNDIETLNEINQLMLETNDLAPNDKLKAKRLRLSMEIYHRTLFLETLEEKLANFDNKTNSQDNNSKDESFNKSTENNSSSDDTVFKIKQQEEVKEDKVKEEKTKTKEFNPNEFMKKANEFFDNPKTKMAFEIIKDEFKKNNDKRKKKDNGS